MPPMATKYARVSKAGESRPTPYRSLPTPAPGKGRRMWIYFCFLALFLCLLFAPSLSPRFIQEGFIRLSIQHGEAVVVSKRPAGEAAQPAIEIAIGLPEGREARVPVPFPEPYWTPIQPGDRIAVVYRPRLDGKTVKVLETGLVALPAPMR